jgi:hypothetical protein
MRTGLRIQPIALFLLMVAFGMIAISQPGSIIFSADSQKAPPSIVIQSATGSLTGSIFDHVVIIVMENEGIFDICRQNPPPCSTTGPAPYMAGLANNYTIGSQYLSLINTSQPNYVALLSGSMQGCTASGCPVIKAPNLVDRFEATGLTWRGYFEDQNLARGCDLADHAPYTVIHNPFIAFQDITNNTARCNKIFLANPSSCGSVTDCVLVNDLNNSTGSAPNFMWLTPNDCHNMRGSSVCGTSSLIGPGNTYLSKLVPSILKSRTFTTTRSALFITFDEGNSFCPLNNSSEDCLYNTWVGPVAKNNFVTTNLYNQYSFPKTIETNWNLASLTTFDANARAMTEYFKIQPPDFGIAANPAGLSLPTGTMSNSTITLSSINNFTGTIILTRSSTPTGLTLTLNPTSVTLTAGGTATSTLSVSSTQIGSYTAMVTGTSGNLSHNTTLAISVTPPPNFALSAAPSSLTLSHGLSGAGSPVAVNSTGDQTLFESSYLASSFYAKGLIWFFYEDSRNICEHQSGCLTYTTSVNGSKWAPATTIPVHITDSDFSVTTNGTSVFYVRYNETSFISNCGRKLQFGLGNLSNSGTVSWQPEQTVAVGASNRVYVNDEIIVDSNGQVWIAYLIDNHSACGGNSIDWPQVIHSVGTDYTMWAGNFTLSTTHSSNWHIALVSLGNGQVYASYWLGKNDIHGRLYNNGWQPDEQISSTTTKSDINAWLFNSGTNVYTIYFDNSTETFYFASRSSAGTWTIRTIGIGETHTGAIAFSPSYYSLPDSASYDAANNQFHLFYMNATNHRIDQWIGAANNWTKTTGLVNTAAVPYPDGITSFLQSTPLTIGGVFYISGSSSPFTINYAVLTFTSSTLTGTFTTSITSQNGFTGSVTLTIATTPSTGLAIACSLTTITGGSGSSLCSLSSTTPGNYNVNITGVSGSLSHSATVAVTVPSGPDFSILGSSPPPANVGQSLTSTITVAALSGFTGTISLTDTIPSGLSCGAISPNTLTNSGTATVSCTATISGNYTLTITGTSGSLSHSATAVFRFQDFTINATSPAAVNAGQSPTSTVSVAAVNGFAGTVTFTVTSSPGLACASFTPTSVSGSGSTTVSCSSTVAGNYTATIIGTSTTLVHNTTAIFQFRDFTISITPISPVNAGNSAGLTITVSAVNHFSGPVTLTDTVSPGLVCGSITPSSLTGPGTALVSCSSNVAGNYTLIVTGTNGALSHSATVTISVQDYTITANPASVQINAGSTGSAVITIMPLNHFSGTVSLSLTSTPGLTPAINPTSISGGSGTATLTFSSNTAGNYTVTINGSNGTLTHSIILTVHVVDFAVTASPSTITILAGATGNSTVTITALNRFSGTVSLMLTPLMGLTATIAPASVAGSGSATIRVSTSTYGDYSVMIKATSGSLSHTIGVIIHVLDYSLANNPSTLIAPVGSNTSSSLTTQSLNGYSGNITLTFTVQPDSTTSTGGGSGGGGHPLILAPPVILPNVSINPASFLLSPGGTQQSTLSISLPSNLPAGIYLITVTATDGTLAHQIVLTLSATDFRITATPNSASIPIGSNATIVLNLQSLNFFQGNVTLTVTSPPNGPTGTLSTSIVQLTFNSSQNLNLTIKVPSNTAAGNYTITIQATSGTVSHTLTIPVRVTTGLLSVLAGIFNPDNSASISGVAIVSLFAIFATPKIRASQKQRPRDHRRRMVGNHISRRTSTTRSLPYSFNLPLLWKPTFRDEL